jgi:hypothetical protein
VTVGVPAMPSEVREPEKQRDPPPRDDGFFLRLWLVVVALWTAATLLRVARLWVPVEGWHAAFRGLWLWLELVLPPAMFGLVILAVRQIAGNHGVFHLWGRRRRHRS